jgi:hypothetical protein
MTRSRAFTISRCGAMTSMKCAARLPSADCPLAFAGEPLGMVFAYLDARAAIGHFLELVWKAPGGWEKIGWPEGKPSL